jgi:uncharacterized membrane protein YeiH
MAWEVLNMIGTIAFAISGAIVATEEKYDILGIYILGIVTAFGGGAIRNLLLGVPVHVLWEQELLIHIALVAITLVFLFPRTLIKQWHRWGNFTDAIGLSAFAINGALYSIEMGHTISAAVVAAVLTGCGGGMIRDLLGGRKPLVLRAEIYALWAILAGLIIGYKIAEQPLELYILFIGILLLRILSYTYNLRLPNQNVHSSSKDQFLSK